MKNVIKKFIGIIILFCSLSDAQIKKTLFDYRRNVFSQTGEDGMIKKIFELIGTTSKIAVEFGAWDGIYLSNTANLWTNDLSWTGILIEGDEQKYSQLINTVSSFYNCKPICEWVGKESDNCLEAILNKYNVPLEIDLLCIDIDGNDYYMIESLNNMRPRVIVIEYNPTIPVTYDIYAPYSINNRIGSSVGALVRIAQDKGYKLVGLSTLNAFFVLESDFEKCHELETDLRLINIHNPVVVISNYDGKYALISNKRSSLYYGLNEQYKDKICGEFQRIDVDDCRLKFDYLPTYVIKN